MGGRQASRNTPPPSFVLQRQNPSGKVPLECSRATPERLPPTPEWTSMATRWSLIISPRGWEGQEDALAELIGVYSTSPRNALRASLQGGPVVLKRSPRPETLTPLAERLQAMGVDVQIVPSNEGDSGADLLPASTDPASGEALSPSTGNADDLGPDPAVSLLGASTSGSHPSVASSDVSDRSGGWGAILGPDATHLGPQARSAASNEPDTEFLSPAHAPPSTPSDESSLRQGLDLLAGAHPPEPLPSSARSARVRPSSIHRPGLSALASLVAPGCGQAINGEPSRGLLVLLTSPLILPWLYGVFDAGRHALALKEGRELMNAKRSPVTIIGFLLAGITLWVSSAVGFSLWTGTPYQDTPTLPPDTRTLPSEDPPAPLPLEPPQSTDVTAPTPAQIQEERRERRLRQQAVHQLMVQARRACAARSAFECLQLARDVLQIEPTLREARALEADALLMISEDRGTPIEFDEESPVPPPETFEDVPPNEASP